MKKIISLLLCLILFSFSVIPAFAVGAETECREYLKDGSYYVETVEDSIKEENEGGIFAKLLEFLRRFFEFLKGQKTVTKTKCLNYYSADNELLWTAMLDAEFIYSKSSVVCTSARFNMNIYDSDWVLQSFECEEEGNTAKADFAVKQYKLLVPLKTIEKTMILVCDTNGNVQ